jgi:hypothetical protein
MRNVEHILAQTESHNYHRSDRACSRSAQHLTRAMMGGGMDRSGCARSPDPASRRIRQGMVGIEEVALAVGQESNGSGTLHRQSRRFGISGGLPHEITL